MGSFKVPLLVLCFLPSLLAQCCLKKTVSGELAVSKGLNGVYTFADNNSPPPDAKCADGCVYTKEGGGDDLYCFEAVSTGADIKDEQCDAVTTQAGTTQSSDALREQAVQKKSEAEDLTKRIEEDKTKKENAEDTKDMIKGVTDKVSNAAGTTTQSSNRKGKREATTKAVDVPDTCSEFNTLYNELLDEAISISDDNIAQIKIIVDALNEFEIDKNCNSNELKTIAEDTAEKAKNALSKTDDYLGEVETRIENNKAEVNKLIEEIENINNELEDRQEATVQYVQSTFFIESTTQGLTEPAGGNNEGTTGPAAGEVTTQPSGENNEETTKSEGNNEATTQATGGNNEETTKAAEGTNEATTDGNNEATTNGNNEATTDVNIEATTESAGGNNEVTTKAGGNIETTTQPAGGNNEETTKAAQGTNEATTNGNNEATTDGNNEATTDGNKEVTTDGNNEATTKSASVTKDAATEPQTTPKGEMSTAKPQKLLFAVRNRRSRGSMI